MAETIIGRHQEKTLLEKYYNSGKAEFIAMYGRRRIGKTFLIRQYFKNQFSFDMTGVLEGNKNEQITAFHMALKTYGYTGKKNTTWLDAFFALRQLLEPKLQDGKRCVIFIDELPCLDTPKAGFVHALGHFWNSWANWQPQIMLIVCGSATSWMVRNIIDNHGGLHDRVTHEMPLHPFTLAETEELCTSKQPERLSVRAVLSKPEARPSSQIAVPIIFFKTTVLQERDCIYFFNNSSISLEVSGLDGLGASALIIFPSRSSKMKRGIPLIRYFFINSSLLPMCNWMPFISPFWIRFSQACLF